MLTTDQITKLDELAKLARGPHEDSTVNVAAVGLVELVWRNSPLEDMHASRRGPSDGEMFAESVALYRVARDALFHGTNGALLGFELWVLDRRRPWAAGGRTLQEMGYGHLTAFEKHVKTHISFLMMIKADDGPNVLLNYLMAFTTMYGARHYGMPRWTAIVSGVRDVLGNPAHPAWYGRGNQVIAAAPIETPNTNDLCQALLDTPDELPLAVLNWLTRYGVMMAADSSARL
jgi:hypothetical protein